MLAFDPDEECVVDHTPQWAITSPNRFHIRKFGAAMSLSAMVAPNFGFGGGSGEAEGRGGALGFGARRFGEVGAAARVEHRS